MKKKGEEEEAGLQESLSPLKQKGSPHVHSAIHKRVVVVVSI